MLVLTREQRQLLADTAKDMANIAAGAMIFGQFLSERAFSAWIAAAGVFLWIGFVAFAVLLAVSSKHE